MRYLRRVRRSGGNPAHKENSMAKLLTRVTAALGVIVQTPAIVDFLEANDPKALEQCRRAFYEAEAAIQHRPYTPPVEEGNPGNWDGDLAAPGMNPDTPPLADDMVVGSDAEEQAHCGACGAPLHIDPAEHA